MPLPFQELLPAHISNAVYCTTGVALAAITLTSFFGSSRGPKLDHIPTVGSRSWLGSWVAAITYIWNSYDVLQEGYEKYKGTPFKISMLGHWTVVVSGRQYVEEFNKARDDELNFLEGVNMTVKTVHTLGPDVFYNPYHVRVLRLNLNRNIVSVYNEMRDEVATAFDELLNLDGHEWKAVPALTTAQKVVARASTRVFVGLPLCRDPDWIELNLRHMIDVVTGGITVGLFPKFMASFVVRNLTSIPKSTRRGMRHLSPIIEARWKHVRENGGSWADSPNDFLTWLMQASEGSERDTEQLVKRVLAIGLASIHNASSTFTQVLYDLAANPQYIQPLREEVEAVIKEEGWTRAAVSKMHKVDSFVKETQRMHGTTLTNMVRMAMKDVTFSDGTVIPQGSYVVMATQFMHFDEDYYEHPKSFEPFRFANLRTRDDVGTTKHALSTTSPEYLPFGHGRHACPGRFFLADELTTMLAHIVASYDVKLEGNGTRPADLLIADTVSANPNARVLFRKRVL